MRRNFSCLALLVASSCLLVSCESGTFDLGTAQYYMMAPRIPSVPVEGVDYDWEPYAVVWGVLGTVGKDGPTMTPTRVGLGGRKYSVSRVRTHNENHRLYYMFEVRDQNPIKGLPVDLMTGNLIATEPDKRTRLPVQIVFRKNDGTVWTGQGVIEQSTMLVMNSIREKMGSP